MRVLRSDQAHVVRRQGIRFDRWGVGIGHSYAPDGRCISLLNILLTNSCGFDCRYCINRRSSNVRRARFISAKIVQLTLSFYRCNYIEGLFLSSGIIQSPDYTMKQIVKVARSLREDHDFRDYIHLKTIRDSDQFRVADRCEASATDAREGLCKDRGRDASIFNPSRVKVGAMLKEMPRKYWKNMPETALIPELIAGAEAREAKMLETARGKSPGGPATT